MGFNEIGHGVEQRLEPARLAGLHEAEVPLGQAHAVGARDAADHGMAERAYRIADKPRVTGAGQLVDHHAREPDAGVVGGAAMHDGGRRLRLAAGVHHEQDRPAGGGGDVGGRAGAAGFRRNAVEQAHRSLAQHEIGPRRGAPGEARDKGGSIAHASRLRLGRPDATAWKAGSM